MITAKDIKKVCCYGAGMIGSSWAASFAMAGYPVVLLDIGEKQLNDGMARIKAQLQALKEHDCLKEDAEIILSRISTSTNPEEALKDVQYIQESCSENFKVKHIIVENVEKYAPVDTIFGSSSSFIDSSKTAEHAEHKERYVSAHPYNPPLLLPFVEITGGPLVAKETLETVKEFLCGVGKMAVALNREIVGYICNRVQTAQLREYKELMGTKVANCDSLEKCFNAGYGMACAFVGPDQWSMVLDNLPLKCNLNDDTDELDSETFACLSNWEIPSPNAKANFEEDFIDFCDKGLPGGYKTLPECSSWRDDFLVMLLKHHKIL